MKNKGFTLIELLATISILAIVLLIAGTSIGNIIEASRKKTFETNVSAMVKAANTSYQKEFINKYGVIGTAVFEYSNYIETSNIPGLSASFEGIKPKEGNIIIRSDGKTAASVYDGQYCGRKYFSSSDVSVTKESEVTCLQDLYLPTVVVNGAETYTREVKSAFVEPTITAYNMVEEAITTYTKQYLYNGTPVGSINTNLLGTYVIRYTVTDEGYTNTKDITLNIVDTTKPVITLVGSSSISVALGSTYTDQGATVTDNYYTGLTVTTSNPVNTNIANTYTVRYNVTDASGNIATEVTRTVTVNARTEYRYRDYSCSTCSSTCYNYAAGTQSCPGGSSEVSGECREYTTASWVLQWYASCPASKVFSVSYVGVYSGTANCPGSHPSMQYIPWETSNNCPSGSCVNSLYCYSGESASCYRTVSKVTSCPGGYTWNGSQCQQSYTCYYECNCSWGSYSAWSTTVYTASGTRQVETRLVTSI